ncbi:MAG: hypothetical protein H7Y15_01465, partial [Pseudonocardia sp.]|nr:hypothetical protein [Pseudonocardia sp.]
VGRRVDEWVAAGPDFAGSRPSGTAAGSNHEHSVPVSRARAGDGPVLPDDVLAAAAVQALLELEPTGDLVDPFDVPGGWRIGEPAWTTWRMVASGHDPVEVRIRGRAGGASVGIGGGEPQPVSARAIRAQRGPDSQVLGVAFAGVTRSYRWARDGETLWIGRDGFAWGIREQAPLEAAATADAGGGGPVLSPMPGTVTVVEVVEGQRVVAGERLVVVEAMKMEHVLTAPVDGVVRELRAEPGATVARDAALLTVEGD